MMENYIIYLQCFRDEQGATAWEAWHPRLPACRCQGATPAAAQAALAECRDGYLQALAECGLPAPLGDTMISDCCVIYIH